MNQDLVDAQQARRVIDRLVGYKLSPLLWKKIRKGLSAGRVQSVAVRLVCEREEEIEKFVPVESWTLDAMLSKIDLPQRIFAARLHSKQGSEEKLELTEEGQVNEIVGNSRAPATRCCRSRPRTARGMRRRPTRPARCSRMPRTGCG